MDVSPSGINPVPQTPPPLHEGHVTLRATIPDSLRQGVHVTAQALSRAIPTRIGPQTSTNLSKAAILGVMWAVYGRVAIAFLFDQFMLLLATLSEQARDALYVSNPNLEGVYDQREEARQLSHLISAVLGLGIYIWALFVLPSALNRVANWTSPPQIRPINFKVGEKQFQEAMRTGNPHPLFQDPITKSLAKDPVAIIQYDRHERPMVTVVFDRTTIDTLVAQAKQAGRQPLNPLDEAQPLDFSKNVFALPQLKRQIEAFEKKYPELE